MINNLGEAIRSRRKELKITAEELAKKVGIDRTFVSKIENNKLSPSRKVLERIERTLKTTSLFELYIKRKNPFLENELIPSFYSIPPAIRKEFQTHGAEELMRFIQRHVESDDMTLSRENYYALLKAIAPKKASDDKLFNQVLGIVVELRKKKDAYWQEFLQQSKHLESMITDQKFSFRSSAIVSK